MPLRAAPGEPPFVEKLIVGYIIFNSLHSEVESLYSGSHLDSNLIEMTARNACSESEVKRVSSWF